MMAATTVWPSMALPSRRTPMRASSLHRRTVGLCEITHSHVWHDWCICVTWPICMCDTIRSCVSRALFKCVRRKIHMEEGAVVPEDTHVSGICCRQQKKMRSNLREGMFRKSRRWYDSFICVTKCHDSFMHVTKWHDSFMCVTKCARILKRACLVSVEDLPTTVSEYTLHFHVHASCHTYRWITRDVWMHHITHIISMRRVIRTNALCQTYECAM